MEGKYEKHIRNYPQIEHINTEDVFSIDIIVPLRGGEEKLNDKFRVTRFGLPHSSSTLRAAFTCGREILTAT